MPTSTLIVLRSVMLRGVSVDREAGCIRRVPVITAGQTKPSGGGHGSFDVDAVTLGQVADAINNAENARVRSRITHPEVEGVDGIDRRVGYFMNASVEGGKVYADFHFGTYATEHERIKLCGLVEEEPHDIGVSIVSEDATFEPTNQSQTGMVLRLNRLDAIDWTDDPAANPAGMLSASRTNKGVFLVNTAQSDYLHAQGLPFDATEEQTAAFIDALSDEQKQQFAALKDPPAVENAADAAEGEGVAASEGKDDDEPVAASEGDKDKPTAMTAQDVDKAVALALQKDRERREEIDAIALNCGYDKKWVKDHIDKNTPIDEVRRVALVSLKRSPDDMTTSTTTVGADFNRDTLATAVQDAIFVRAGRRQAYQHDQDGQVILSGNRRPETRDFHERSNEFRGLSLTEMARKYFLALGCDKVRTMSKPQLAIFMMSRSEIAAAMPTVYLAHATGDFPFLLADSMGKVLRQEYALAPHTWEQWCQRGTAPDFKDIKKIQLSEAADLAVVPEGDEIEYGVLSESREVYALSTYAKGLKFTRQMLINDDLSAFDRVPRMMGRAAARNVEKVAIAILTANANMADSNALFSTAHANLTTGALSVTSLGAAKAALMKQTALGSDDPLESTPRVLLVPSSIETTARQLISSTVDPTKSNATPNPFANALNVVPSARLDSDSTTQWYLFADNNEIDTVEVGFLEGVETPVIEEEDEFDSKARKVSIMHDTAAKAIDWRGMIRSSGA